MNEETIALCTRCGNYFTYLRKRKDRTVCDRCRNRQEYQKGYYKMYGKAYYEAHKEKIKQRAAENRNNRENKIPKGAQIEFACKGCGKAVTYSYAGGRIREYCDKCLYENQLEHTRQFMAGIRKREKPEKPATEISNAVDYAKRAREASHNLSKLCREAREHNLSYGKYIEALERGETL